MLYVIAFLLLVIVLSIPNALEIMVMILLIPLYLAGWLWEEFKENPLACIWYLIEFTAVVGGIVFAIKSY